MEQAKKLMTPTGQQGLGQEDKIKKKSNLQVGLKKLWDKILGLNLLVPICLLVCPWKLKVAALAQGCLMLLLLLLLHCSCSARAQLTPKRALPLPNKCCHPVVGKTTYCSVLVGCLSKDNTAKPPHLLQNFSLDEKTSYAGMQIV